MENNKVEETSGMDNKVDTQSAQAIINRSSRLRRLGFVAAGIGFGSIIACLISRVLAGRTDKTSARQVPEHMVDDRGTGQAKAARILLNLRDRAFEASDDKLAVALGRPAEEVAGWNAGSEVIDDDVVMKARGIAMARGIRVE